MIERWLTEKLGFRQKSYQRTFDSSLADLAVFSGVWDDTSAADVSDERLRELHGRRQVFFRILKHLKLTPAALEAAYVDELERRAKLRRNGE